MAHELEIANGQARMFYVNETPWHGLGIPLLNPPTVHEGIVAAGLNWSVGMKPLFTSDGTPVPAQATFRQDDGKILGVVGPQYKPLQNIEAFNFFDPFLQNGLATLETAGSLRQGTRIWVLAQIKADPMKVVGEDEVRKFILLSNSHDGTTAVRVGFTPIRVVCANTLAMAIDSRDSALIRVRHAGDVAANVQKLGEIMNLANATFEANAEQYRFLTTKQINAADLKKYVELVFDIDLKTDRESRILAKVIPLFEKGRGNDLEGVKGTYWAAYNAAIEYMQYEKGKDQDRRLDNNWFGAEAARNRKALDIATTMAKLVA